MRRLAKKEYYATLAQLGSRISTIMKFGGGVGIDPLVKVKSLFTDLINRLQVETSSEASHNLYCVKEMSKVIEDFEAAVVKQSPKLEVAVAKSTVRPSSTSLVTLFHRWLFVAPSQSTKVATVGLKGVAFHQGREGEFVGKST